MYDNIKNEIFDSVLKSAFYDIASEEFKDEPSKEELSEMYPLISKETRKIKRKVKEKECRKPLYKIYLQRSAIVIFAIITALFTVLTTNSKVRAVIADVIIEWYETHIKIEFVGTTEDTENFDSITELQINYIPDGFELVDSSEREKNRSYTYMNDDNYIMIEFHQSKFSEYKVDIEHNQYEEYLINGMNSYILSKNDDEGEYTTIVIGNSYLTIVVDTSFNREETIKIAENIKK